MWGTRIHPWCHSTKFSLFKTCKIVGLHSLQSSGCVILRSGGCMLTCTFSAEMDLTSAFSNTLFSLLSHLFFSCLSGDSFPLHHISSPSFETPTRSVPAFSKATRPSRPSLFPLKLSSTISPTNLPAPSPSHFHWRQPSRAEILAPPRGSFPRCRTLAVLSPTAPGSQADGRGAFNFKARTLFSREWGCRICKLYKVNWWSDVNFPYSCLGYFFIFTF